MTAAYVIGALAVAYAGMVALGAWIAHEMNKRREVFGFGHGYVD